MDTVWVARVGDRIWGIFETRDETKQAFNEKVLRGTKPSQSNPQPIEDFNHVLIEEWEIGRIDARPENVQILFPDLISLDFIETIREGAEKAKSESDFENRSE